MLNSELDSQFMKKAIELAKLGEGHTNPNPLVGAVIVKDNKIIGQGYHHKYGDLHAERDAIKNALELGNDPKGASIYVTLEPCCHFGNQPPCTHAIVESGITKVVIGSRDPNPLVHGKGTLYLKEHNVEVVEDFFKEECDSLNSIFFHYITTGLPYVALKYASTMDGKIATVSGKSKWITNSQSRQFVHQLRNKFNCILCGIQTVLADDPMLSTRIPQNPDARNPVRIIADSSLRIPVESSIVKSAKEIRTIIACGKFDSTEFQNKKNQLEQNNVEVFVCPDSNNQVDFENLFRYLGSQKLDSVLVEGGGTINYSILKTGMVNSIYQFVGGKIFGGNGKTPVGGNGIQEVEDSWNFKIKETKTFGTPVTDILIHWEK